MTETPLHIIQMVLRASPSSNSFFIPLFSNLQESTQFHETINFIPFLSYSNRPFNHTYFTLPSQLCMLPAICTVQLNLFYPIYTISYIGVTNRLGTPRAAYVPWPTNAPTSLLHLYSPRCSRWISL